jgi:hypothetical protein
VDALVGKPVVADVDADVCLFFQSQRRLMFTARIVETAYADGIRASQS